MKVLAAFSVTHPEPLLTNVPGPLIALETVCVTLPPKTRLPSLMAIAPVKVLEPASTTVPAPALTREEADVLLVIGALSVSRAVGSWLTTVSEPPASSGMIAPSPGSVPMVSAAFPAASRMPEV
ncbi:MAG: hypothetical protein BWX70_02883 [Verrucomicrobia bacterium ADurb.Bin070]|nr:MAG: hypothetical protein BWX70_02883 [Verrucomicrobia bacterium ADurb.Bin070]